MKSKILALVVLLSSSFAVANELVITSEDVGAIEAALQLLATGQNTEVAVEAGTAYCQVNSMAELPGYRCIVGDVLVSNNDVTLIEETILVLVSGGTKDVQLESGTALSCFNNTFSESPGYRCYHAEHAD